MGAAVLPFLGYLVLQLAVMVLGLNIVRDREIGVSGVLKSWIFGQMICFAVLQVMAVPMILARWDFNILFWSYMVVCMTLFGLGGFRLRRVRLVRLDWEAWDVFAVTLLVLALVLIGIQFHRYLFMMHLDEDDARWLAEANDALVYGDMFTRSFDTGGYLGRFALVKDVTSPWSLMYAIVSRVLHTRTAIFAHTIYAPIELLIMYGVYWLIAAELFKKNEARAMFVLSVAVINLFFAGTVYTQSVFSLIRIWQGKATVAAVIIPLLFYLFLRIHMCNHAGDWMKAALVTCAASLMSGTGIMITAIMVGVYGAYDIVAYRRWKRIPLMVVAILPAVTSYLIYAYLKG